jgi:hypothetical protein
MEKPYENRNHSDSGNIPTLFLGVFLAFDLSLKPLEKGVFHEKISGP